MPQHLNSFASGVDVPEAVYIRRHRRRKMRSNTKPSFHGGQSISRRPAKAYVAGGNLNFFHCLNTLIEEAGSDDEQPQPQSPSEDCSDMANLQRRSDGGFGGVASNNMWPSLHDSTCDWDLVSEVSDITSFSLMSEAASDVTAGSWVEVASKTRLSYAACIGTKAPDASSKVTVTRTCFGKENVMPQGTNFKVMSIDYYDDDDWSDSDYQDAADLRAASHGWKKSHKCSRGVKAVQKVAESCAKRNAQRMAHRERLEQ
eukprot:TRINITY_DN37638_c0_g1_i1.p1 TRINITY_DN37638_c0_g1~~TRINITY_DN37638_c0_g1_i1.p1  ORF type:complete len:258 (-),score=55.51 TRINITY_DN37638_c0_g1_i1:283-1056(-)